MSSDPKISTSIRLYRTTPHPCSYKDEQQSTTVFVDPELAITQALNTKLSSLGYRRSGAHLYRPDCAYCDACISCRIPVNEFQPKRSQKKILRINKDLRVEESAELDDRESFDLYCRYINTRHRDGDMFPATKEQYQAFIATKTDDTRFYKFYADDKLLAVSVTDILLNGLSAVYTFFDPSASKRSLGSYVILWQIEKSLELDLPYLYLGYWINNCQKMSYKNKYRPIQLLITGKWLLLR
jgi:arginine-tRNA-protein transferase